MRISVLAALLLGCAATPPRVAPEGEPMTTPVARPDAVPPAPSLVDTLAAQGHAVMFTTDGGEPSLVFVGGQLRGYARTGRTADAVVNELRFGEGVQLHTFLTEGLDIAANSTVRIVPLHTRGERAWFSVIEVPPAPAPWRVRLFERSGGRGKLLASHDSYAHTARTQIRWPYEQAGEVAIVELGASLYAVAGGRVLVLDGPGADAARFEETEDPDCPPNKRCYRLPAEIDAKRSIGRAPSGRSFVMAGEGDIRRRDTTTGEATVFRYENFFYTGLVEEDAVVLAHAGEPPFVQRWTSATLPSPPPPRGYKPMPVDVRMGHGQRLVDGPGYVQLARTTAGALVGVTVDGALDRIADGRPTPVVRLPAGHKVVAVAAGDGLAFVVASDASPPVHTVVVADR